MKNSWEWDENDLLELVKAGTQENIEYGGSKTIYYNIYYSSQLT